MNDENNEVTEKKLPTEDAKNALRGALKGIPKSFLLKVLFVTFFFFLLLNY